jgi:ubiquinone/menaquinone biosynthesis C-methylase UbiE
MKTMTGFTDSNKTKGKCMITGWERENRTHFDEIVLNYDKTRPEYPKKLFDDIFDFVGSKKGKKALEIGAGTGKATAPFLDMGYNVTAIEIGANMADFLQNKFKGYKNFCVINAAFEDISLDDDNFDLIYAGSAFHWIDAKIGVPKVMRLLRNNGVFALFRYNLMPAIGEALYEAVQAVYEKYYHSYYKGKNRPTKRTYADFETPSENLNNFGFENLNMYGFRDVSKKFYDAALLFNADEYVSYLNTMSDNRHLPENNRTKLYSGIKEAILLNGGSYREDLIFQLYMGRK